MAQILIARPGYKTLTNRACELYDAESGECSKYAMVEYDLKNPDVRKTLASLGFICKVSSKRFKIDLNEPVLKRRWSHACGLFKTDRCWDEETLNVDQTDYFIAAHMKCFDPAVYRFDEVGL